MGNHIRKNSGGSREVDGALINKRKKEGTTTMAFNQKLCDEKHEHISKDLGDIKQFCLDLKQMHLDTQKRLFIDNGTESHQSKINRHDRWIKGVCIAWFVFVLPMAFMFIKQIIAIIESYVIK